MSSERLSSSDLAEIRADCDVKCPPTGASPGVPTRYVRASSVLRLLGHIEALEAEIERLNERFLGPGQILRRTVSLAELERGRAKPTTPLTPCIGTPVHHPDTPKTVRDEMGDALRGFDAWERRQIVRGKPFPFTRPPPTLHFGP